MRSNKKLVEDLLTKRDHDTTESALAEDVEWVEWADGVAPGGVVTRGKAAFIQNYGDDRLTTEVSRLTEENNVVVAEGITHVTKADGRVFHVQFVDIYELQNGKVKRKSSFAALLKDKP